MGSNDIDLIERYFDLELSEQELTYFEKKLVKDKVLFQKVKTYKESLEEVESIYQEEKEQLISDWKSILEQEDLTSSKKSKVIPLKLIAAAAAVLIFMVLLKQWYGEPQHANTDLAIELQNAWDKEIGLDYMNLRSGTMDNPDKSIITNAYLAYRNGEFDHVSDILNNYSKEQEFYEDALLLKALAAYKKGSVEEAIQMLEAIMEYPSGRKKDVAQWYKGLLLIEKKDLEAAKKYILLTEESSGSVRIKPLRN